MQKITVYRKVGKIIIYAPLLAKVEEVLEENGITNYIKITVEAENV